MYLFYYLLQPLKFTIVMSSTTSRELLSQFSPCIADEDDLKWVGAVAKEKKNIPTNRTILWKYSF